MFFCYIIFIVIFPLLITYVFSLFPKFSFSSCVVSLAIKKKNSKENVIISSSNILQMAMFVMVKSPQAHYSLAFFSKKGNVRFYTLYFIVFHIEPLMWRKKRTN